MLRCRIVLTVALAPLAFPMAVGAPKADKPQALRDAEAARDAGFLSTAHIEYSRHRFSSNAPGAGTPSGPPRALTHYYAWKCAPDAYIKDDLGDEEGVAMRGPDGKPRTDLPYHGPKHFLVKGGEAWLHVEESPIVDVFEPQQAEIFSLADMRRIGLDPVVLDADFDERMGKLGVSVQYDASVEGGLQVVTGTVGDSRFRWWIDPDKGWNVVRTAVWHGNKQLAENRLTLEQFDGFWFPRRIEVFRLGQGDTEPYEVITILSAEFNRPHHPADLTPADIGVEPGATIDYHRSGIGGRMWDGEKPVPMEEFFARLNAGKIAWGPNTDPNGAARRAKRRPPEAETEPTSRPARAEKALDRRRFESEWEKYTRRFIIKYRLLDDQAQKAWTICRSHEELGRAYLDQHRADFDDWQKRTDALRSATAQERDRESPKLERRRPDLMKPIDKLFESGLKPGLEKLPTTAQREATEKRAKQGQDDPLDDEP